MPFIVPSNSPHLPPDWLTDLYSELLDEFPHVDIELAWFPSSDGYGWCTISKPAVITIYTTRERTDRAVMVAIHEFAHAICPSKSPNYGRGGFGYHGIAFCEVVAPLYDRYGVLEYAREREGYQMVAKYCREVYGRPAKADVAACKPLDRINKRLENYE